MKVYVALIVVFTLKSHLHKQVFDKNPTNKMGNMDGQRGLNISLDPLTIKKKLVSIQFSH